MCHWCIALLPHKYGRKNSFSRWNVWYTNIIWNLLHYPIPLIHISTALTLRPVVCSHGFKSSLSARVFRKLHIDLLIAPRVSNDKKNKNEKSTLVDISVQLGIICFLFQGIEIDFLKAVVILTDFYLNIIFELNFMKTCWMWLIRKNPVRT